MNTLEFGCYRHHSLKCSLLALFAIMICFACIAPTAIAQVSTDHLTIPGFKPPEGETGEMSECLKRAHIALRKKGPIKAVADFKICTNKFPQSPFPHFGLAMAYFSSKKMDKAIHEFKQVLKIEPDNQLARAMLGKIYSLDKNKFALAEDLLKEVVKKNPYNFDARIDLARTFARQKKIKQALANFGVVLSMEKRFAQYHLELGTFLMAGGALPQARKEFERALVLSPGLRLAKEQLKKLEQKEADRSSKKLLPGAKSNK